MLTERSRITDDQVKEFLVTEPVPIGLIIRPVEIWLKRELRLQKEREESARQGKNNE